MQVKKGMRFIGNISGRKIEIIEAYTDIVKYRDLKYNTVFVVSRKAFEQCDITQIK